MFPCVKISCVVSIGTGSVTKKNISKHKLRLPVMAAVDELKKAAVQTELTHRQFVEFASQNLFRYFRLNPTLQSKIGLDDYKTEKINLMLQTAQDYIKTPEVSAKINEIILLLKR
jgi:hypothetical protein